MYQKVAIQDKIIAPSEEAAGKNLSPISSSFASPVRSTRLCGPPFTTSGSSATWCNRELTRSKSIFGGGEDTWRSLLGDLSRQPLESEAFEVLNRFNDYAANLESSLQQRLHAERHALEETWLTQKSGQRMKPSSYLLQMRASERALAKSQNYAEAARVKRDADQQEKSELARHERDLKFRHRAIDATLRTAPCWATLLRRAPSCGYGAGGRS